MTNKRWKIRTNTVNSLLVLIVLILVKAGWTEGQSGELPRKLTGNHWTSNNLGNQNDLDVIVPDKTLDDTKNQTVHKYLNRWNGSQEIPSIVDEEYVRNLTVNPEEISPEAEDEFEDPQLYESDLNSFYGESVADTLFHESTNNNSLILTDLSKCLYQFNFLTCLKMLLLNRVNNMLHLMHKNNLTNVDFYLLNGYVAFKRKNDTTGTEAATKIAEKKTGHAESKEDNNNDVSDEDDERYLSLDQELSEKVIQLFKNRSLQISLLPGFGLDIRPMPKKRGDEFVCFSARTFIEPTFNRTAVFSQMRKAVSKGDSGGGGGGGGGDKNKSKKKKKKKKGGFSMMPMMIIPQMVMLGFLPFALANLKMMVMNAFMINSMALNSAIFMTIRNLIFGPRGGPKIKYVNYGYKKNRVKSKKPSLIIHSPAAFVPQPEVHHKPEIHHQPEIYHHEAHHPEIFHEVHHQPPKHVSIVPNSYPNFPIGHESSEDVSGPYSAVQNNHFSSSELEESYDYDHSGQQHGGPPEDSQLNLSNIKYTDDSFGEFSNPKKRVVPKNRYVIRKKNRNRNNNANRRKSGQKPVRVKAKTEIPPEVKTILDKLKKKNEKKNIPLYRNNPQKISTTLSPISEEESEENVSQDVQPNNLYHPITNYYYPHQNTFETSPAYVQIFRTTEKTNAWSVPEYPSVKPSVNNPSLIPSFPTPVSYNTYNQQNFPTSGFQEPETPDYNFDILRLMPDVRNKIYQQKPTEKNYLATFGDQFSQTDYSGHGQKFSNNQIDRRYSNTKNNYEENRNEHQVSTDYRTVFSSKYNKDHVNFDKHSENKHQNHNYARS